MSLTGVVGGLRRAIPIAVITFATENHLGSCPVGIAYPKRVWASRPRCVADDHDELLRAALAHHAKCSPVDHQFGPWGNVGACQANQQRSIAPRVYQDPRHHWHRIAQGSQLLGASLSIASPSRSVFMVVCPAGGGSSLLFVAQQAR